MKRGTVREDGMIYFRLKKGKEEWLTKERYKEEIAKEKKYRLKCRQMYYAMRKEVFSFGQYDEKRNLYYIGISSSGKPIWRNKKFLERRIARNVISKKRYYQKCCMMPATDFKLGDPHPENPNLFVILKLGNRITWGDAKRLAEYKEKRRIWELKRDFRNKRKKAKRLEGVEKIIKGTKRPDKNLIFWKYTDTGNEVWLEPETFAVKREHRNLKRRLARKRKKDANSTQKIDS